MRALLIAALIGTTGGAAAAKGAATSPPPELIATVARGPAGGFDGVRDFANAVKPGAGLMISDAFVDQGLASAAGLTTLDGLDAASPMYLLFVDGGGANKGFVLVARITDEQKVAISATTTIAKANGWGAIGPAAAVKKVSAYALGTLAAQPAPTQPSLTIHVGQALARYKAEIARGRAAAIAQFSAQGGAMASFGQAYLDGLLSAATDSDRLVLTIDANKATAAFDIALVPRPRTRLAKFVAAQHASDYALLDSLPPTSPSMLFAGHLEAGPYRAAMLDLLSHMYGAGAPPEMVKFMDDLMKASNADVAMTMDLSAKGMSMAYLFGLSDEKAANQTIDRLLAMLGKGRTFDTLGMRTTMKAVPGSTTHDGVTLRAYDTTYDLSTVPAASRAMMQRMTQNGPLRSVIATFDSRCVFTAGADADTAAAQAIDAARGKGSHFTPTKDVADLLAASRARKESMAMVMDLGALSAAQPAGPKLSGVMVMTMGFADGATHLRMAMPSAMFKSMAP